jgi:hypothetical protein
MAECTCQRDWNKFEPTCSDYHNCTQFAELRAENEKLKAALELAERAIEDCHEYRSHTHFSELVAIRSARSGGPTVAEPDRPYCKPDQSCCDFTCGN